MSDRDEPEFAAQKVCAKELESEREGQNAPRQTCRNCFLNKSVLRP